VDVYIDLLAWKSMVIEIIGLFIVTAIFNKTGKAFPFIVAGLIPFLHHIAVIAIYFIISRYASPFDFDTPHGKVLKPFLEQQGFPLDHVFMLEEFFMPNAAYSGTWPFSRHIFVTGSMLEFVNPKGLLAIFGHELGHGAHFHQLKREIYFLLAGMLVATLSYHLLFKKSVYEGFGFTESESQPDLPSRVIELKEDTPKISKPFNPKLILTLIILPWLFAPLYTILPRINTVMGHFGEYQADRYSMGFGFARELSDSFLGFIRLSLRMVSSPVYDYTKNTHPTVTRRINRLGVYELNE